MKLSALTEPWISRSENDDLLQMSQILAKDRLASKYNTPRTTEHHEDAGEDSTQAVRKCRRRMSRQEFVRRLSGGCLCNTNVSNGEINRTQLLQFFRENYIPDAQCTDFVPLMWITKTAYIGSSAALKNAVSAVSVSTIYRKTNDARMLHTATTLYFSAVREARKELEMTLDPATNVAIGHIFTFCELLRCTSLNDSSAQPHTYYTISVLESNRSNSHNGTLWWFANGVIRAFAAWGLLLWRKCPLDLNISSTDLCQPGDYQFSTLLDLALVVSKIAHDSDKLCDANIYVCPLVLLDRLTEIRRLEGALYDWMGAYSTQNPRPLYWLVDVQNTTCAAVRDTKALFGKIYEFNDLHIAIIHVTFWMSLMSLFQSYARILDAHHSKLDSEYTQYFRVKKMLDEYAAHLCRTMPFMGRRDSGYAGRIMAIRPLHLLSLYFKEQKNWSKLAWCSHCAVDMGSIRMVG